MKVYKIYHKVKKLWSVGGIKYPRWNVKGKLWRNLAGIHNHMNLCIKDYERSQGDLYYGYVADPTNELDYQNWEIVTFEVTEAEEGRMSAIEKIEQLIEKRRATLRASRDAERRRTEAREKAQLEELKKKYEAPPSSNG